MRVATFFTLFLLSLTVSAQVNVGISGGLAHYQVKELRELQQLASTSFPVPVQITDDFPDYWFYEVHVQKQFNKINAGVQLRYGSTGGRISYADYSGIYTSDQLLRCYSLLASIGYRHSLPTENWIVSGSLHTGLLFGSMKLSDQLIIGDLTYNESDDYVNTNAVVEPQVEVAKVLGRIELFFNAGYQLTLKGGKVKLKSDKEQTLTNSEGDPLRLNFDGYRIGLGIRYRFGSAQPKNERKK